MMMMTTEHHGDDDAANENSNNNNNNRNAAFASAAASTFPRFMNDEEVANRIDGDGPNQTSSLSTLSSTSANSVRRGQGVRGGGGGGGGGDYELMVMSASEKGATRAGSGGRGAAGGMQRRRQQQQTPLPILSPHNDGGGGNATCSDNNNETGSTMEDLLTVLTARQRAQEIKGKTERLDNDARPLLPKIAFYMGDIRDGLAMVNMQSTFLMSTKGFSQKQVGVLFLVFGISQVASMAPVGYLLDVSRDKIRWVVLSSVIISSLTVYTSYVAQPNGENMATIIMLKVFQGAATAVQSPGLNSITLGIVGTPGFTVQVSRNKMMCHIGTALVVCIASLLAYVLYPNLGLLFLVSPLFCCGLIYHIRRIRPEHIDTDAARGLIVTSPTMVEYEQMDDENEVLHEIMEYRRLQRPSSYVPPPTAEDDATGGVARRRSNGSESQVPTSVGVDVEQILSFASSMGSPNDYSGFIPEGDDDGDDDDDDGDGDGDGDVGDGGVGLGIGPFACSGRAKGADGTNSFSKGSAFGFRRTSAVIKGKMKSASDVMRRKLSPFEVLVDPRLMTFTAIVFFFNLSNSSVLPLVMQSIALEDTRKGILLSGLCIIIAQSFMMFFAKICGDYSPKWGRKRLFLLGLFSLPVRCVLLSLLAGAQEAIVSNVGQDLLTVMILSTQLLDAVGAGIFGTLYVLVTNDISGGTGRFSLMMGVTSGAMCLGGMASGYIGQALAQDFGYEAAFSALGLLSFIPAFMYLFLMPETLPDYARPKPKKKRRRRIMEILLNINKRNNFFLTNNSPQNAPTQSSPPKVRTHL